MSMTTIRWDIIILVRRDERLANSERLRVT